MCGLLIRSRFRAYSVSQVPAISGLAAIFASVSSGWTVYVPEEAGRAVDAAGWVGAAGSAAGAARETCWAAGAASLRCLPHVGQAPGPWLASVRSATMICPSLVARSARGANSWPPYPSQVRLLNCSPP